MNDFTLLSFFLGTAWQQRWRARPQRRHTQPICLDSNQPGLSGSLPNCNLCKAGVVGHLREQKQKQGRCLPAVASWRGRSVHAVRPLSFRPGVQKSQRQTPAGSSRWNHTAIASGSTWNFRRTKWSCHVPSTCCVPTTATLRLGRSQVIPNDIISVWWKLCLKNKAWCFCDGKDSAKLVMWSWGHSSLPFLLIGVCFLSGASDKNR